jgi:hypothetical protein
MSQPIPLTKIEREGLLALLGGLDNLSIQDEAEFLQQTGCPPKKLESWLGTEWISCDIQAVLAKKQRVGLQPVLLTRRDGDQISARLFYPKEELVSKNDWANGVDEMCARIAAYGWAEAAEAVIADVDTLTKACATGEWPTIEIKLLWLGMWMSIKALLQLWDRCEVAPLRRLQASIEAFNAACQTRGGDQSPQGKYREALVNSRHAWGKNQNSALQGLLELVETAKKIASHEVADYVIGEVGLQAEQYLDAVRMMACDGCNPAEVVNPPARVRTALEHRRVRVEQTERKRWRPFDEEEGRLGLEEPEELESRVISEIDWDRGKAASGLSEDEIRAVEARMSGLKLQASGAGEDLGLEEGRLRSIRRSLEPDRSSGRKLRQYFAAYLQSSRREPMPPVPRIQVQKPAPPLSRPRKSLKKLGIDPQGTTAE